VKKIKVLFFPYIFLNLSFAQSLIVDGLKTIDLETINNIFSLKNFDNSLKSLYKLQAFSKIELIKKNKDKFILKVKEYPKITKIIIKGNKEFSKKELLKALFPNYQEDESSETLNINSFYLSLTKYKKILNSIKNYYKKHGFSDPKLDISLKENPDKKTYTLVISIKENKRYWVKNIFIKGNKKIRDSEIKDVLLNKEQAILLFRFRPPLLREYFPQEIENIKALYKRKGYLDVQVKDLPFVKCTSKGECNITYVILKEGSQYKFGDITIINAKYFDPKDILKKVKKVRKGKPFNYESLEKLKHLIIKYYQENGFYNSNVIIKPQIDKQRKIVNVKIICIPGKRYFLNRINIKGNYKTKDWTLRRELDLKEKYIFSPEGLFRSFRQLYQLGFIEKVEPKINIIDNQTLNLTLKVKERAFGILKVGAAWNTVSGFFARASVSRANLKGTGDTINFSAEIGKDILYFDIFYKHYFLFDKPINVIFNLYRRKDIYEQYTSTKTGISINFEEKWKKDWYFSQKFTVTKNSIKDSKDPEIQNSTNTYFIFSPALKYNTLDNPYLPHNGSYIKLLTNLGYDFSNTTRGFFKGASLEFIYYINVDDYFYNKKIPVTLMNRVYFGICSTNTPIDYKFYLGGDYSIRGYDYGEIGTFNKIWTNTIEVGYDFGNILRSILFLDIGGDFKKIYGGYGFGFRLLSPLGPIRFDFGWKMNPKENQNNFNFHFGISSYF